jgi:alkylated DNA repair dioxygenase AlkB
VTGNLFEYDDKLTCIPMPDADVSYHPCFVQYMAAAGILRELTATTPWRTENIVVWGKRYVQPRLTAWYGDASSRYNYSGIALHPLLWTPLLLDLKRQIESIAGITFNSVLLNYYRDNHDSMGFHSDDERELGSHPVIASLSFGEVRTLIFKHKTNKALRPVRLQLASGSLLLMQGRTQHHWKHGIDKETRPCGPRINLTFRQIKA